MDWITEKNQDWECDVSQNELAFKLFGDKTSQKLKKDVKFITKANKNKESKIIVSQHKIIDDSTNDPANNNKKRKVLQQADLQAKKKKKYNQKITFNDLKSSGKHQSTENFIEQSNAKVGSFISDSVAHYKTDNLKDTLETITENIESSIGAIDKKNFRELDVEMEGSDQNFHFRKNNDESQTQESYKLHTENLNSQETNLQILKGGNHKTTIGIPSEQTSNKKSENPLKINSIDCKDNKLSKNKKKKKKKKTLKKFSNTNEQISDKNDNDTNQNPLDITGVSFDSQENDNSIISSNILGVQASQLESKYNKFQAKLNRKLEGGHFRWINEQLYSIHSSKAAKLFESFQLFELYHNGFTSQVKFWPQNPVDLMIKFIKESGDDLVIGDFGCGDAKIASCVSNTVYSFDLVAVNNKVTPCDMKKVPLPSDTLDIAVFCLSLMGTNIEDFIREGRRVLKMGGLLKIAEVKSRFQDPESFIEKICLLGFNIVAKDTSNKMFIIMDFQKTNKVNIKRGVNLKLNPCIYKKR